MPRAPGRGGWPRGAVQVQGAGAAPPLKPSPPLLRTPHAPMKPRPPLLRQNSPFQAQWNRHGRSRYHTPPQQPRQGWSRYHTHTPADTQPTPASPKLPISGAMEQAREAQVSPTPATALARVVQVSHTPTTTSAGAVRVSRTAGPLLLTRSPGHPGATQATRAQHNKTARPHRGRAVSGGSAGI